VDRYFFIFGLHVGIESLEICVLALAGGDCLIEVVADVFPRTVPSASEYRRK
jgi:hypothetical protein